MLKRFGATLAVLLAPGLGFAQAPAQGAQMASNDPAAKVACTTANYFYWACHPTSETPEGQGVGAAAARMAACMSVPKAVGSANKDVVIPFLFKGLTPEQVIASADCPFDPAEPIDPQNPKVVYGHRPTGDDIAKYYPAKALDQELSGTAVLECKAVQNRYGNCRILRESPLGLGFGAAAQRIATLVELRPLDEDNQPVEGRLFRYSVTLLAAH